MSYDRNEYQIYIDYVGFKQYFKTWDFTWSQHHSTIKTITYESFLKRKDCNVFRSLWKNYRNRSNIQNLYISAFIIDPDCYIGSILNISDDINDFHKLRMESCKNLQLTFDKDCVKIKEYVDYYNINLLDLIKPEQMSPKILRNSSKIGISLETISIIDKAFKFSKIKNDSPIWEKHRKMIFKYSALLNIDVNFLKISLNNILKGDHM